MSTVPTEPPAPPTEPPAPPTEPPAPPMLWEGRDRYPHLVTASPTLRRQRLALEGWTLIGVDPGGRYTGVAVLEGRIGLWSGEDLEPAIVVTTVREHVARARADGRRVLLCPEAYVVGGRASRSGTPEARARTQSLLIEIMGLAQEDPHVVVWSHTAARVKGWADATRLQRAGVAFKAKPHATDAARHALYSAVIGVMAPDPEVHPDWWTPPVTAPPVTPDPPAA